jgi:hypothetical protein
MSLGISSAYHRREALFFGKSKMIPLVSRVDTALKTLATKRPTGLFLC